MRCRTFEANDPETGDLILLPLGSGAPTVASSHSMLRMACSPSKLPAAAPNFEKPADADKDNVYEVTITATDGNANMATRDVKVTVTNAEEAGKVTLSQPRPRVGLAITASYSDPDGGLASATWQWWRTDAANDLGATLLLSQKISRGSRLDRSRTAG